MRPSLTLSLSLCLAPPVLATAQEAASPRLAVGSTAIQPRRTGSTTTSWLITPPAPGTPTVLDESLVYRDEGGRAVLVKSTRETTGLDVGGDTLVMAAATLAPIRLVTYGGGRTRILFFDGAHVTGTIAQPDGTQEVVDTVLPTPAFAGPSFFTVLSSLNITPNLDVTIPFFRPYDRKLVWVRYRALGSDNFPVGGSSIPAWRIVGEIDGAFALYWMRQDTHELLRVVSFAPNAFGPIDMVRR